MFILGEFGSLNVVERQALLSQGIKIPDVNGPALVPGTQVSWLYLLVNNYLVFQWSRIGNIIYKLFEGRSFQLLINCRVWAYLALGDLVDSLGLSLYHLAQVNLSQKERVDYLSGINILDFVVAGILADLRVVGAIARVFSTYNGCLICTAGTIDYRFLNVAIVTTVNVAVGDDFLLPYGLLSLTWDSQIFINLYDRGVSHGMMVPPLKRIGQAYFD